jgi:aryl-alcohol dehydrogenase-like predicted oxidoreductase
MEYDMPSRPFGRTGRKVKEIGFGAWAIGEAWDKVDDAEPVAALHAALDAGLDFIDTADVYGDGGLPALPQATMEAVARMYEHDIRPQVHQRR